MKAGIIYYAENISNGKRYIGQTVKSLAKRKSKHLAAAFIHGVDCKFYQALKKYGEDFFSWGILEEISIEKLDEREAFWIRRYRTLFEGYNMTEGGPTLLGHKHTEETKKKISESMNGRSMKDHYIEAYGKEEGIKKYEEYIEKLKEKNGKGRKRIDLFIEKHGEEEGKRRYNEMIRNIKKSRTGKDTWMKGRKHTEKAKKLIGENTKKTRTGAKLSEEHRMKISEAQKRYWANKKKGKD